MALEELRGVRCTSLKSLSTITATKCHVYDTQLPFYYDTCAYPIPDLLKASGWIDVSLSRYSLTHSFGSVLEPGVTNQNLESLTYADGTFDIVITSDVMEHVRLDEQAHREIFRILKSGGLYLFTVPHDHSRKETMMRVKVDADNPDNDIFCWNRNIMEIPIPNLARESYRTESMGRI